MITRGSAAGSTKPSRGVPGGLRAGSGGSAGAGGEAPARGAERVAAVVSDRRGATGQGDRVLRGGRQPRARVEDPLVRGPVAGDRRGDGRTGRGLLQLEGGGPDPG